MLNEIYSEISKSIIGSLTAGIKRRPQIIIHFQVSLLILLLLLSVISRMHSLNLAFPSISSSTAVLVAHVLILVGLILSLVTYVSTWNSLVEKVKEDLLESLEEYFNRFPESFEEIIDMSLWDLLELDNLRKLIPSVLALLVFPVTYYGLWLFSLLLVDLILFDFTGHSYIGLMLQHPLIVCSLLIPSLTASLLFIDLWPVSGMRIKGSPNIGEYMRYFFENVFLSPKRSKKSTAMPKLLLEILGKILTPIPYMRSKIILADVLDILMNDATIRRFDELLSSNDKDNRKYRFKPLRRECGNIRKVIAVKVPLLSSACWYKVTKNGRTIGYIMVFRIIIEKFPYVTTTKRIETLKEQHLYLVMFGTEEIIEIKYVLLK
jgi:hypothetical protein